MLGTYQQAIFAVPENPVMRAVVNAPILMTPTQQKGVTGFGASAPGMRGLGCGSGCGCKSNIQPFGLGARAGMGNVGDEGLRLYGDWYGAQQTGGMVLNGDRNGLGSYFPSDAHGYRGFSGLGDLETMVSNFTSGNFGAALTGNDIASSVPNWLVIGGAIWLFSTITGQASSVSKRVKRYV